MENRSESRKEDIDSKYAMQYEFLEKISREIRIPINTIVGLIALISQAKGQPGEAEKIESYLAQLDQSAHYLIFLINDMFETTQLKNGGMLAAFDEEKKENYNFEGRKILLAEDNELNADIVAELLKNKKAEVEIAYDGQAALDIFLADSDAQFDAVLMDIRMPVLDGLEATKRIRSSNHKKAKTIPVIALSANAFKNDIDEAFTIGMDAYTPKPVDIEDLYQILHYLWKKRENGSEDGKN